ncbi:SMC-Scp complex subunit ScpB [Candidatus Mycoplasma mahonii]|uniref:SMC-Scp complex subunit ScpB n=1 Tax=Candidatus Mycoplasma mahonii TaxID=3004105 RepID=UPI0026E9FE06|nr:SMC-Scp complex subunit ScpB [Candidatus Mycoplasma mahonii]WKX02224.1 SMC-Scp complex subunit ScpB [Candidatus Mycoplasma mahonii]
MNNFKDIEAMLYVQGDAGLSAKQVKYTMDMPTKDARKALQEFQKYFNAQDRGTKIVEFNDVFKIATREESKNIISKLVTIIKKQRLSASAIETAGIIAYKQPITKSQINLIRGKSSEAVVNTLVIKGLVESKGSAETPGNPDLFVITDKFYDYFQIKSLNELPKLSKLSDADVEDEDFDLYASQRQTNE